jgi:hypothetical protein
MLVAVAYITNLIYKVTCLKKERKKRTDSECVTNNNNGLILLMASSKFKSATTTKKEIFHEILPLKKLINFFKKELTLHSH